VTLSPMTRALQRRFMTEPRRPSQWLYTNRFCRRAGGAALRSQYAVHQRRGSGVCGRSRAHLQHDRPRPRCRQCGCRGIFWHALARPRTPPSISGRRRSPNCCVRLHRALLQSADRSTDRNRGSAASARLYLIVREYGKNH